ncbi:vitamin D3 receptor-like isoform X2 [Watersipora subatra]|uniref:vitamin D3 receptor-like isoform X2 n=1 Tax=Watersipora subatra TaxID=2589382 RepID=UPI00355C055B
MEFQGSSMPGLHALWESVFMKMEQEPEQLRHRGRPKEDKYCGVCGDKALGYNFDAISCESCKAFFRRNAPKGLEYFKCPYDEKCKMDVSNRRFCKRCRLKKCFDIGMRKEYILSEEERMRKRQKIEENRRAREIEKMLPGEPMIMNNNNTVIQQEEESTSQNGSVDTGIDCMEVDTPSSDTIPLDPEEAIQIAEIVQSYKSSLDVCSDDLPPPEEKRYLNDLVNVCEVSIRRVIDMAKKIKIFKSLPQITQICLLKGGSIELLIIRSVLAFDKEKAHFLDSTDNPNVGAMTLAQFQQAATNNPKAETDQPSAVDPSLQYSLVEDIMKFIKVLAVDLQADETMLILLLLISLFSPDRPNLNHKDIVSREQERLSMLLQHYIESKIPLAEARLYYPKLLMKLTDIRDLNEESSQVFLNLSTDTIQPLMKEVLDLKKNPSSTASSPVSSDASNMHTSSTYNPS